LPSGVALQYNKIDMVEVITKDEFDQLNNKVDRLLDLYTSAEKNETLWFNNDELAEKLNVSKRTLQNYRDEGKIEFVQIGRKIFYTVQNVNNFLNDNTYKQF